MKSEKLTYDQFHIKLCGQSSWEVEYQTKKRRDYWKGVVHDCGLIDSIKNMLHNEEEPKQSDLKSLRSLVKWNGNHYNKNGKQLGFSVCGVYERNL